MNITKIERYVRVLALPVFLMVVGGISVAVGVKAKDALLLASVAPYLAFGGLGAAVFGVFWMIWALFQMDRWERGSIVGTCPNCGGAESSLDGKYGPYRRCRMCGAKREGW